MIMTGTVRKGKDLAVNVIYFRMQMSGLPQEEGREW